MHALAIIYPSVPEVSEFRLVLLLSQLWEEHITLSGGVWGFGEEGVVCGL